MKLIETSIRHRLLAAVAAAALGTVVIVTVAIPAANAAPCTASSVRRARSWMRIPVRTTC
jgi:hypothetical protein